MQGVLGWSQTSNILSGDITMAKAKFERGFLIKTVCTDLRKHSITPKSSQETLDKAAERLANQLKRTPEAIMVKIKWALKNGVVAEKAKMELPKTSKVTTKAPKARQRKPAPRKQSPENGQMAAA